MALTQEEKDKRKAERKIAKWNSVHRIINGTDYKLCSICNEWHPSTEDYFYPNKMNSIDGLYPYCIECNKSKSWAWQTDPNNREKFLENKKRQNAKEEIKLMKRKNSEARRKSGQRDIYYLNNPDRFKGYGKARSNKNHDISDYEWDECRLYFNYRCAYCGLSWEEHKVIFKQDLHKEHVIHNGKDDLSNCIPSCKTCNSEKWEHKMDDWYNENNLKYDQVKLQRINQWLEYDYLNYFKYKKYKNDIVKYE